MRRTEIAYSSSELSKKERVAIKNATNLTKLDKSTANGAHLVIVPKSYVILAIENDEATDEKSRNYKKIIITDVNGERYTTGSQTFIGRFCDIFEEMEGEEFELDVYSAESKKYEGKFFITCDLIG